MGLSAWPFWARWFAKKFSSGSWFVNEALTWHPGYFLNSDSQYTSNPMIIEATSKYVLSERNLLFLSTGRISVNDATCAFHCCIHWRHPLFSRNRSSSRDLKSVQFNSIRFIMVRIGCSGPPLGHIGTLFLLSSVFTSKLTLWTWKLDVFYSLFRSVLNKLLRRQLTYCTRFCVKCGYFRVFSRIVFNWQIVHQVDQVLSIFCWLWSRNTKCLFLY